MERAALIAVWLCVRQAGALRLIETSSNRNSTKCFVAEPFSKKWNEFMASQLLDNQKLDALAELKSIFSKTDRCKNIDCGSCAAAKETCQVNKEWCKHIDSRVFNAAKCFGSFFEVITKLVADGLSVNSSLQWTANCRSASDGACIRGIMEYVLMATDTVMGALGAYHDCERMNLAKNTETQEFFLGAGRWAEHSCHLRQMESVLAVAAGAKEALYINDTCSYPAEHIPKLDQLALTFDYKSEIMKSVTTGQRFVQDALIAMQKNCAAQESREGKDLYRRSRLAVCSRYFFKLLSGLAGTTAHALRAVSVNYEMHDKKLLCAAGWVGLSRQVFNLLGGFFYVYNEGGCGGTSFEEVSKFFKGVPLGRILYHR